MPSTTIALSRVVELNVPLLWQEVVAVARAVGTVAVQTGQPISLDGFAVSAAGAVTAIGSSQGMGSLDVYGLAAALLEGQPSPSELRDMIAARDRTPAGNLSSRPTAASQTLGQVEALGYFATPNPEADIAALAGRALEIEADAAAKGAIERLRTDTAAPAPPLVPRAGSKASRRLTTAGAMAGMTIAVILSAGIVSGLRYFGGFTSAPDGSAADRSTAPVKAGTLVAETLSAAVQSMTSTIDAATDKALEKMGLVAASETAAEPPVQPVQPRPRRPARASRTLPSPPISGPIVARGMDLAPAASLVGDGPGDGAAPLIALDPTTTDADPDRVYSSADVQVAPPALVYPQLPTLTLGADPDAAHLRLVVDELGNVRQARLVSTGGTVGARMLVFAAKTWRFAPASVDGRPVRYLLRVPVAP